jgi:Na+-transporting methylmalonyl-CoA/oxaloacetate decarboxylase gamma subunit
MGSLGTALQITLVGMGLVFGAILLLWVAMALLVKFTSEEPPSQVEATSITGSPEDDRELRQRAASAAVALAMSMRKQPKTKADLHKFPKTLKSLAPGNGDASNMLNNSRLMRFRLKSRKFFELRSRPEAGPAESGWKTSGWKSARGEPDAHQGEKPVQASLDRTAPAIVTSRLERRAHSHAVGRRFRNDRQYYGQGRYG